MKIVKPSAALWLQTDDVENHIIKCAKVCYAAENSQTKVNKHDWLEQKWNNGHKSIFRHGTYYFAIPVTNINDIIRSFFKNNPYIGYYENNEFVFCSVNGQTYKECSWFHWLFKYSVNENGLLTLALTEKDRCELIKIIRRTVYVQTQISTSRELNRTSPNNICEQSTRFCNFTQEKFDSEVKLCQPHWMNLLSDSVKSCIVKNNDDQIDIYDTENKFVQSMHKDHNFTMIVKTDNYERFIYPYLQKAIDSCDTYNEAIKNGVLPQDARGILPLDAATKVVYTYRIEEWAHILNLRYYGTTGKPHPNAKITANQIREVLNATLPKNDNITEEYEDNDYFPELIKFR